jgi:hypothetical protein
MSGMMPTQAKFPAATIVAIVTVGMPSGEAACNEWWTESRTSSADGKGQGLADLLLTMVSNKQGR